MQRQATTLSARTSRLWEGMHGLAAFCVPTGGSRLSASDKVVYARTRWAPRRIAFRRQCIPLQDQNMAPATCRCHIHYERQSEPDNGADYPNNPNNTGSRREKRLLGDGEDIPNSRISQGGGVHHDKGIAGRCWGRDSRSDPSSAAMYLEIPCSAKAGLARTALVEAGEYDNNDVDTAKDLHADGLGNMDEEDGMSHQEGDQARLNASSTLRHLLVGTGQYLSDEEGDKICTDSGGLSELGPLQAGHSSRTHEVRYANPIAVFSSKFDSNLSRGLGHASEVMHRLFLLEHNGMTREVLAGAVSIKIPGRGPAEVPPALAADETKHQL
ncbi:hypothetical protein MKZ38_010456 [Zalerion maritima]|uniref:Uncharacterized protein n=1 Tax=Zalerion maritima TaxID=339359 RepID=A0AAD5RFN4_9PEZI|nr:hypothetical protein MKZ38_010456 [Zalerion maritima]